MSRPHRNRLDNCPQAVNSGASTSVASTSQSQGAKNSKSINQAHCTSCSDIISFLGKRKSEEIDSNETMSDNGNDRNKRANFSAIASNGINRNINIINLKPTATKKIVIKNLKSKFSYYLNNIPYVPTSAAFSDT